MTWPSLRVRSIGSYSVGFEFAVEYQNIPRGEGAFVVCAGYFFLNKLLRDCLNLKVILYHEGFYCKVTGYVHLLTLLWEKDMITKNTVQATKVKRSASSPL